MTWNFHSKGSVDSVRSAITSDKKLPAAVKTFLTAQIAEPPAGALGCRLDAFSQDTPSPAQMNVTRNLNITLVWIKP
jgi:hypothetical protein